MRWLLIGFTFILIGVIIIMAGSILSPQKLPKQGDTQEESKAVRGGGIVMIGPIPIVFGSDAPSLKIVIFLAIVLIALSLIRSLWAF